MYTIIPMVVVIYGSYYIISLYNISVVYLYGCGVISVQRAEAYDQTPGINITIVSLLLL